VLALSPNQLALFTDRDDEKNALAIKFDSADKTDSVKAGQSQKYSFTPESVQTGRFGNT
jgi:hypothetical protein